MDRTRCQDMLPYSGYRILVADDNVVNCQIAKRMLEKLGCQVDLADSGLQVLSLHSRQTYDLILMDCQMPDMDGYTACSQLRKLEGSQRHTPVIGWTVHAQQDEIERCSAAGMDDCLSKHLRLDGLERMLATWLSSGSARSVSPLSACDFSGLESMLKISGASFSELVALFEEDMPRRIAEVAQALNEADYKKVARISHMMSGCCASIGALHLSDLCLALEQQALSCQHEDLLPEQLNAVQLGYDQVLRAMHALQDQANV